MGCGPGTGIDTKFDKKMTIHVPTWFYNKITVYTQSERAKQRRLKSNKGDNEDNYVFLTNRGKPFYTDTIDRNLFNPNQKTKYHASGGTVRTFIAEYLLPELRKKSGHSFSFHFHNLRATFGMNLSDALNELVEKKKITLTEARNIIREMMCHDSFSTTDEYLDYREKTKIIRATQEHYQQYLKTLSEAASKGLDKLII